MELVAVDTKAEKIEMLQTCNLRSEYLKSRYY